MALPYAACGRYLPKANTRRFFFVRYGFAIRGLRSLFAQGKYAPLFWVC
jgi:hypothetical protein